MFVYRKIDASQSHDSFPLFDWLRFALASMVALVHEHVIPSNHAANFAVQVFYALSGWLIGGILIRSERKELPRFYYNRATRIWIPYFVSVGALYGLAAFHEGIGPTFLQCVIFDSTFTHNFFLDPSRIAMPLGGTGNHFWSISVEEQFYLAAPLLIVLCRFGRSFWLWTLIAAVTIIANFWYGSVALGVLASLARSRRWDLDERIVGVLTAALIAVMVAVPSAYNWICAPAAIGVVLLLSKSGPRSPVGEFFGGVSYPLYLYHWVGGFAAHHIHREWLGYPFAVATGVLAYVTVDRNVMRWRGRFYRPQIGKALMVAAYSLLVAGLSYNAAT